MTNLKNIHIGTLIETKLKEEEISMERVCAFFKLETQEILQMLKLDSLETEILLKWCKILEYDFFRLYSQHLIFYAPPSPAKNKGEVKNNKSSLPLFRKNLYTQEIIDFVIETLNSGEKTRQQVIDEYKIPKTTLYKWIAKYNSLDN
ncbi:transposase [Chryseobacterium sp.]|uniref:transposase n=1 Tax=Chryseobacterium sp. TaxID=1871047 RepID=UPI000EBC536B|nr:transposase [Chryseobacterium sp.]HCA09428.1 transposase [Chryseobacterium sp.]